MNKNFFTKLYDHYLTYHIKRAHLTPAEFMLLFAGMRQYRERGTWNNNGSITFTEADSKAIGGPTGGHHRRARLGLMLKGAIQFNTRGDHGVELYFIAFMPGGQREPLVATGNLKQVSSLGQLEPQVSPEGQVPIGTGAVPMRTSENEESDTYERSVSPLGHLDRVALDALARECPLPNPEDVTDVF